MTTESARETIIVGANPAVTLYDGPTRTAYASVWQVDTSLHGPGSALVLWLPDRVRLFGENADLAQWLERDFTRHFPTTAGLSWPEPALEQVPVEVSLDMADGLCARAADVEVRIEGAVTEREFGTDDFQLNGTGYGLQFVLLPCRSGQITVAGARLPGRVRLSGPPNRLESSAFITTSEIWTR
jgi:hypothetical protein